MNRLKLWVYMAALLGAGVGNLWFLSRWITDRAVGHVDVELNRAVAQVDARSQLLAADAARLADAVARDPAVVQALSPEGGGDPASVARAAAAETARATGADPARPLLVATAGASGRTLRLNGATLQPDGRVDDVLSGVAGDAERREGYAVVADALYYLAAGSAGKGAGVAVGVPVGPAWLADLHGSTGCDVTLLLGDRPPRGTLPAQAASLVANAARGSAGTVDAGVLPAQPAVFGTLPLLFAKAPAYRVRTLALKGLPGGVLALSQATSPWLAPLVGYEWMSLLALAIFLLLGIATGLLVTNEQAAMIPKDLVAAADRITRGDFTARAPVMAGSLGTIATALNRAAEAAEGGARTAGPQLSGAGFGGEAPTAALAPATPAEQGGTSPDFFSAPSGDAPASFDAVTAASPVSRPEDTAAVAVARAEGAAASYEPEPVREHDTQPFPPALYEPPPENGVARFLEPDTAAAAPGLDALLGSPGAMGALAEPRAEEPGPGAPAAEPGAAEPAAMEPASSPGLQPPDAQAAAEIPSPPELVEPEPEPSDEEHWQVVYDEFLRAREECGEPRDSVPYERFRLKLQKNRDQLVAKYACRTVKFQVYVKEGRAALKASPVR